MSPAERIYPRHSTQAQGELRPKYGLGLTFKGWERYRELQKGISISRTAFMAMKYGDVVLDEMFNEVFVPATTATGFKLHRLDMIPRAGIIDNHLRVEIRNARFLLADLSHGNQGAYWEAGFAEGLGRPVIYLCERSVFENPDNNYHPHFDTNHSQTIVWTISDKSAALQNLKNCIRATFPSEAKMVDEVNN